MFLGRTRAIIAASISIGGSWLATTSIYSVIKQTEREKRDRGTSAGRPSVALCPNPDTLAYVCLLWLGRGSNKERTVIGGWRRVGLVGGRPRHDDDIGLFGGIRLIVVDKHVVLRELLARLAQ